MLNLERNRDRLLVNNADKVVDIWSEFTPSSTKLTVQGRRRAFPRLSAIADRHPGPSGVCLSFRYMMQRMRRAWHPMAKGYVYAFAYKAPLQSGIENIVKVGSSIDPKRRCKALDNQCPIKGAVRTMCLLIIPMKRNNAAEYLENGLHGSLPEEDRCEKEWYWDTIGVWRQLMSCFTACHIHQYQESQL